MSNAETASFSALTHWEMSTSFLGSFEFGLLHDVVQLVELVLDGGLSLSDHLSDGASGLAD
jgi:hypothetical protein